MRKILNLLIAIFIITNLQAQKNVLEETFTNNKNNWQLLKPTTSDSATFTIEKNQLIFNCKLAGTRHVFMEIPGKNINLLDDDGFTISADITYISSKWGLYEKGVFFGDVSGNTFRGFVFQFSMFGRYRIVDVNGDTENEIKKGNLKGTAFDSSKLTNTITIEKNGDTFNFLMNGEWVESIKYDKNLFADKKFNAVGFRIRGMQAAAFSNLRVKRSGQIPNKQ